MPHYLPSEGGDLAPRTAPHAAPAVAGSFAASALRAAPPEGPDWRRLVAAVGRYKWIILVLVGLGAVGGVIASRFIGPQYRAEANIWIDEGDRQQQAAAPGPFQTSWNVDPEAWVDLLRSYQVLDTVVSELHLFVAVHDPSDAAAISGLAVAASFRPGDYKLSVSREGDRYTLAVADAGVLERGAVGDSVGRSLGFRWAPARAALWPGRSVRFRVMTPRDAAMRLAQALQVNIDAQGNFLRLALDSRYPRQATAILNAVAQRYVAVAANLKRQKVSEIARILGAQTSIAHEHLTSAEQALAAFQERTATLPSYHEPLVAGAGTAAGGAAGTALPDPGNTGYLALVAKRDQADQDRETLRRLLATTPDSELPVALQSVPAAQQFAPLADAVREAAARQDTVRHMLERYTPDYPPVQAQEAALAAVERRTIPPLVRQLESQLTAHAAGMGQQVSVEAGALRAAPEREVEEGRLRRDVALADNLYSTLQQRYDEAQIAEASSVPSVRVLDQAESPENPLKDTAPRIVLVAVLGALLLGVVGAVALDRLDPRFRYPEQVSRDLGLPILGTVPHLTRGDGGAPVRLEDAAAFIEALRGIRMNLLSELGGDGPLVVAISSPGSGDGKSFLAANLARVFAEGGRRTLLVDADIRRGLQHRRFGVNRRPGLADYLRGEIDLAAIVRHTPYANLDVVTCGTRAHDAPELLGSAPMDGLVAEARGRYDVVLCDCPPLSAGVDPFVVGAAVGRLVLIVRTGVSRRELTQTKLEVVGRMKIRLQGAVLNDVPAGAIYRGYSYYLPGYEGADERAAGQPHARQVI